MTAKRLSRLADHNDQDRQRQFNLIPTLVVSVTTATMFISLIIFGVATADIVTNDVEFLNELPLDKLLRLKSSLQDLVTREYGNITETTPSYPQMFGAQAMAIHAQPPIKRGDYEEALYKKEDSKISNIFSISVTTLAFLAFGGYLLCLIVQAVKAKQIYNGVVTNPTQPTTFFVSAGIKKKPQPQFASYGRRKRESRLRRNLGMLDVPSEQMFSALLQMCEGYAKWSEQREDLII